MQTVNNSPSSLIPLKEKVSGSGLTNECTIPQKACVAGYTTERVGAWALVLPMALLVIHRPSFFCILEQEEGGNHFLTT